MAVTIQRALLSVSDKTHIVDLAKALYKRGIEILSTGNTARLLQQHKIPVIEVSQYTGFPEMMDGRLKTLHPKIHGGILGRRDLDHDVMHEHHIDDIDLVVVNLYPFEETVKQQGATLQDAIANIDIGGPAMIRSAAKNHEWVAVVVDPKDYQWIEQCLNEEDGQLSQAMRYQLASKAFHYTAQYDGHIANYLSQKSTPKEPETFGPYFHLSLELNQSLRYGENPHQKAAFYRDQSENHSTLPFAEQLQGKPLSYNNIIDSETALCLSYSFDKPSCAIIKHANPCGVALGSSLEDAYLKAFACDPVSSYGGIIALNHTVGEALLNLILKNQFAEVIIAPQFTQDAIECAQSKPNLRLLATGTKEFSYDEVGYECKSIRGGMLVQTWDNTTLTRHECTVVSKIIPNDEQWNDLLFAFHVAKQVKSNAIVLAKNNQTLGIGAGQMSRLFSVDIAHLKAKQANLPLEYCVLAGDAFFPFKDGIEHAAQLGVKSIIQPGGSIRDQEVIDCCNQLGLSLVLSPRRHFRH